MSSSSSVDSATACASEAERPSSASDSSARARSLQLLKKKLGAAATRRGKGAAAAVVAQPSSPPPLPGRPLDSAPWQPTDSEQVEQCVAASLSRVDSPSGRENPATNQDEEERKPEEIPIAALKQQQQAPVVVEKRGGKRPSGDVSSPASSSSSADTSGADPSHRQPPPRVLSKTLIKWSCRSCQRECIPIREESRCLCGHRYKEHPSSASDPRVKGAKSFRAFACTSARCACPGFFYVVAEGAWVLRCRCKHKHVDHDASRGPPFACKKPSCSCAAFDSPWVCNCDHPWADHAQEVVTKQLRHPLELLAQSPGDLDELSTVLRTDLLAEPLQLRL